MRQDQRTNEISSSHLNDDAPLQPELDVVHETREEKEFYTQANDNDLPVGESLPPG